jgi:hypothetical protein
MAGNYHQEQRPLRDEAVPLPREGYKAGGKDQGDPRTRKNATLNTGTIGYVPGHSGTGRGSSAQAGGVDEVPRESARGPMQYGVARPAERPRPMPREIPVQSQTTRFGNLTRFLDGHSEVVRERPGLVEMANHPDTPPDDRAALNQEIAHRDAVQNHRYW